MKRISYPTPAQEHAVLRTVLYAAVFDYPLTLAQLHESLIGVSAEAADIEAWYAASHALQAAIEHRDGFFFPRGCGDLLELRKAREVVSRRLLQELEGPLALVLGMPFVRMVALSGSLAHLNARGETDLDLFVITKPHRVWSVTTTLVLLARVLGWRKRLCLNYVISEEHLQVEPCDLFSANQIVHLRPITGIHVYRRFLAANRFVADYYPNFESRDLAPRPRSQAPSRAASIVEWLLDRTVAWLYERVCGAAYGWHLRRRAPSWESRDQVRLEPECLKLHTSSHRKSVMDRFDIAVAEAERVRLAAAVPARAAR